MCDGGIEAVINIAENLSRAYSGVWGGVECESYDEYGGWGGSDTTSGEHGQGIEIKSCVRLEENKTKQNKTINSMRYAV